MRIRHNHIFTDPPQYVNPRVNPYLQELLASKARGQDAASSLPLLHGAELQGMQGRWRNVLAQRRAEGRAPERLILEIGIYKGKTLVDLAKRYPQVGFVGLDITFKRVVLTARKLKAANLPLATAVLADARCLSLLFAPGELDGIVAFFPDPWEKKLSQRHNRLFSFDFCQQLRTALSPTGSFWFKSDSESYFAEVAEYMQSLGLQPGTAALGLVSETSPSNFEELFCRQGLPIYEGWWQKVNILKSLEEPGQA